MPPAAAKLGLDRGKQVLGVAVHVVEVPVAGDPERVMVDHLHAWEQRLKVKRDDVFDGNVAAALRQRDQPGQYGRDLYPREALLVPLRVANDHREVERQVRDVRKWMRRVDRKRGQHREDLLAEHRVELAQLLLGDALPAHERDPGAGQGRHQVVLEDVDLPLDQAFDPAANRP